jgi:hypothetical protein
MVARVSCVEMRDVAHALFVSLWLFVCASGGVYLGHYRYYSFIIDQANFNVSLAFQFSHGLADLYLSMNPANTQPTMSNYDFASDTTFLSTDVMLVPYAQFPSPCRALLQSGGVRRLLSLGIRTPVCRE